MKRVQTSPRALARSHSGVVAKLLAPQFDHYGTRATNNFTGRIEATGIRARLYQTITGGRSCSCGVTSSDTILDDAGHLTPAGMADIVATVSPRGRGREIYDADDVTIDVMPTDTHPPMDPRSVNQTIDEIDLLGLEERRCGLCFGLGFVGGYQLANGYRQAFDADTAVTDHVLDKAERPFALDGTGTYAEWTVTLPLTHRYLCRVWNGDEVIGEIEPVVPLVLGQPHVARFLINYEFTHVEMISVDTTIPVDVNTVQTLEVGQQLAEVQFQIPASFAVPQFSVIADSKYNAFWQVKLVAPVRDHTNRVIYQEVTARQIRGNEIHRKLLGAS